MVRRNPPEEATAPLQYDTIAAIRQELRNDVREYVKGLLEAQKVRIDAVTGVAKEAKTISSSAKDEAMKPHSCLNQEIISAQGNAITNWSKWWRNIMITLLIAIVSVGGVMAAWWADQSKTRIEVTNLHHKIEEIDATVRTTKADFDSFRIVFEQKEVQGARVQEEQMRDISKTVTEVIKAELRKSRRR